MRLLISMDEHYLRGADGNIYSTQGTSSYDFWRPFLQIFPSVSILARVRDEEDPRKLTPRARANGEGVDFCPIPDFRGSMAYLKNHRQVVHAAVRAVEDADAFLLHGVGLISGTLAGILCKKELPFAVQVIGDPWEVFGKGGVGGPMRLPLRWYSRRRVRWICRNATAVWYVTEKTLQRRYPANPSAYQTGFSDVQLGDAILDERQLAERIHALEGVDGRIPKLGFIGTFEQPYKGADTLLRAIALCARQGVALTCELVGEGKLRGKYEDLALKLGLGTVVRFAGRLPAGEPIFRFLDSVDLFVMPSLVEGLPRAMVEAMARGCPAIGSRVGGIPELLREDCLFPAGDQRLLAQLLLSKLNSDELCKMARANRAGAGAYAPVLMAQKRTEFLLEILARATRDHSKAQSPSCPKAPHAS